MSTKQEIRAFLISRRGRLGPAAAGLRAHGGRRRVAGLRREEVALLAGISVEYYVQVERGDVRGVSEDVLEAIARALQLNDVERSHLFDLVRAVKQQPRGKAPLPVVRPGVQRVLDALTDAPAFVRNQRLDILSANRLGYALYADAFADPARPVNLARFVFLDPQAQSFYRDWPRIADDAATNLRAAAGRDPYDHDLTALVGELSMLSTEFGRRWATHDVGQYRTGTQPFHHRLVGDLNLDYEALTLTADGGLTLVVYTGDLDEGSPLQQLKRSAAATPSG